MSEPRHPYDPSLDQLLHLGEPDRHDIADWLDYRAMGMGPEHVPDLIRMATDEQLNRAPPESVEVWAPIHAMRALAQLGAVEAAEPLLEMFREYADDDWLHDTLPEILARLGPTVVEPVVRYLSDSQAPLWTRAGAADTLRRLAEAHPETREGIVAALVSLLERFTEHEPTLNAELIATLVDLQANEAAGLMEGAFAADAVDLSINGDWEDTQVKLGLKEQRETPRPNYALESLGDQAGVMEGILAALERRAGEGERVPVRVLPDFDEPLAAVPTRTPPAGAAARAKARKKMEKQSRKKNRKRR